MADRVFDPYEATALARFNAKPYRDELAEGTHPVNFVCRVAGDLVVAPPYERLFITVDDYARLVHLTLARNPQRLGDYVLSSIRDEIDESALKATKDELAKLYEAYKPKTECKGAVQGNVRFTRLAR